MRVSFAGRVPRTPAAGQGVYFMKRFQYEGFVMGKVYRKTTIIYIIALSLGVLTFVCLNFSEDSVFSGIGWLIAWTVFCCVAYFAALTSMEVRVCKHINECEPSKFISHAEKAYSRITEPVCKRNYSINLFAAYHALGNPDEGMKYLSSIKPEFPCDAAGALSKHAYYINRSAYFQGKKDFEGAELEFKKAQEVINAPRLTDAGRRRVSQLNERHRYGLNIEMGIYEGAEEFYSKYFLEEKALLSRVDAQYNLALIYKHKGDVGRLRDACSFVINNGKETFYVKEAEKILMSIDI